MCVFRRLPGILSWNFAISTRAKLIASVEGEKENGENLTRYLILSNIARILYTIIN